MNEHNDGRHDEEDFVAGTKAAFDRSVDGLDGATRSQLNRSRQRALAELATGNGFGRWYRPVPLAGMAAAVLVAVLFNGTRDIEGLAPPASVSDFEILLDSEDLEMLEDLEFYSWIDLDDAANGNVG